jgi:TPR repeat protein
MGLLLQVGGPGVTKNDGEALVRYERACAAGNGWACLYTGDAYQRGYGVKPDFGKSSHFFLKACDGTREGFKEECQAIGDRMMM